MRKEVLRSIMVLHGDTNKDLADFLGISEQSVSNKINENGTEFKQGEIARIKTKYNFAWMTSPNKQIELIFIKLATTNCDSAMWQSKRLKL